MHGLGLFYVLDLAEIPTFQEPRADADGNGQVSDTEAVRARSPGRRDPPRLALRSTGVRPARRGRSTIAFLTDRRV